MGPTPVQFQYNSSTTELLYSALEVLTCDHAHDDASTLAGAYCIRYLRSYWVLDTDNRQQSEVAIDCR